jgi:hypothetical protein
MLNVTWVKSTANTWLPLHFNIAKMDSTSGVYVIWHAGQSPWTVRVGQGDIAARLAAHGNDTAILAHASKGPLHVTWAALQAGYLDGVERYLADQLQPLVGDRHPAVVPVPVNLPWAA